MRWSANKPASPGSSAKSCARPSRRCPPATWRPRSASPMSPRKRGGESHRSRISLLSLCSLISSACSYRYLFWDWEVLSDKPSQLRWRTDCPVRVSDLFCLESLQSIKGFGSAKLLNARLSKPAETAMVAIPPATACLKTNLAGDRMLIITSHLAIISAVRRFSCPS